MARPVLDTTMQWSHIIGPILVGLGLSSFLLELFFPVGVPPLSQIFFRTAIFLAVGLTLIVISGHYLLLVANGITSWQPLSQGVHTRYATLVIVKIALALGVISLNVFVVLPSVAIGASFPIEVFWYIVFAAVANIVLGTTLRRNTAAMFKPW